MKCSCWGCVYVIAFKLKETFPLTTHKLVIYTRTIHSISVQDIMVKKYNLKSNRITFMITIKCLWIASLFNETFLLASIFFFLSECSTLLVTFSAWPVRIKRTCICFKYRLHSAEYRHSSFSCLIGPVRLIG